MICFDGVSFFKTASPPGIPQSNSFFKTASLPGVPQSNSFFKTASPPGVPQSNSFFKTASPPGVPPDLQSGVKKCPNLLMLCGFAIRSKEECFPFVVVGGLQIPRF